MKKKHKIFSFLAITTLLIASATFYLITLNSKCNTYNKRPSSCSPANNRCLPPGNPNEAAADCSEFKYYEA